MLLRLPWLNSRKRLLSAAVIDAALFSVLYLLWYQLCFGVWPEFSYLLTLLVLFWLVCSYVLGRYYDFEDPRTDAAIKQLTRTSLTLLLSTGVYLFYNWITANTLGVEDSPSLLVPFLFGFGLCSGLAQFGLNRLLQVRFQPATCWRLIGTAEQVEQLQRVIAWGRLNVNLDLWSAEQPDEYLAGLVVPDPHELASDQLQRLLLWQAQGIPVHTTIGWCELVLQRYPPEVLTDVDLLRGEFTRPQSSLQLRLKRLGDVIVSASLLLLCLPLLLLAGVLIWRQDRGPVLYSQIRSGLAAEPFRVFKLRSMRMDAEAAGAQWSGRVDPRITPIGRLLRLTRLDELPQLLAVLRGEMSLIGPRPERPEIEAELECSIPHYRLRHLMRPGLSGWAQVNYPYGASWEDSVNKLSYDLYYLRNYSFWLDLLILVKTVRMVFNAKGALAQG